MTREAVLRTKPGQSHNEGMEKCGNVHSSKVILTVDLISWETKGKGGRQKPAYTKTHTWQSKHGDNDKKQTMLVTQVDGQLRIYSCHTEEDLPGLCNC